MPCGARFQPSTAVAQRDGRCLVDARFRELADELTSKQAAAAVRVRQAGRCVGRQAGTRTLYSITITG